MRKFNQPQGSQQVELLIDLNVGGFSHTTSDARPALGHGESEFVGYSEDDHKHPIFRANVGTGDLIVYDAAHNELVIKPKASSDEVLDEVTALTDMSLGDLEDTADDYSEWDVAERRRTLELVSRTPNPRIGAALLWDATHRFVVGVFGGMRHKSARRRFSDLSVSRRTKRRLTSSRIPLLEDDYDDSEY